MANLGGFEVSFGEIWAAIPDMGYDTKNLVDTVENEEREEDRSAAVFARNLVDTIEDEEREEDRSAVVFEFFLDIASVGPTTVHYIDLMITAGAKREIPPPFKPLELAYMPIPDF